MTIMRLSPIALIVLLTIVALVTAVPNDPEEIPQAITDLSKTVEERNTKVLRNTNLINKLSKKENANDDDKRRLRTYEDRRQTLQDDRDKEQRELDNAALEHAKKNVKTNTNPPTGSTPEMRQQFHLKGMNYHLRKADRRRDKYEEQIKTANNIDDYIKIGYKAGRIKATGAAAIAKAEMTVHEGHANTHSKLFSGDPTSPPRSPPPGQPLPPHSFSTTNRAQNPSPFQQLAPPSPQTASTINLAAQVSTSYFDHPSEPPRPKRLKVGDVSGVPTSLGRLPPHRPTGSDVTGVIGQGPASRRITSAGGGTVSASRRNTRGSRRTSASQQTVSAGGGTGSGGVQPATSSLGWELPHRQSGPEATGVIDEGPASSGRGTGSGGTGRAPSPQLPTHGTTVIGQEPAFGGPVLVPSTDHGGTVSGGSSEGPMWWNPPTPPGE